jgi:hypothetical protein
VLLPPTGPTFTSVHNESTMSQMADEETPADRAGVVERLQRQG